jgi:hypothetical protein
MSQSIDSFLDSQERLGWSEVASHLQGTVRQAGRIGKSDLRAVGIGGTALLAGVLLGRRLTRRRPAKPPAPPLQQIANAFAKTLLPVLLTEGAKVVEGFLQRRKSASSSAETATEPAEPHEPGGASAANPT